MILNLIITKLNFKRRVKTNAEYKHQQNIEELFEQNKLKQLERVLRQMY